MEDNFNKHLGNKLKLRRLALGLTQTKVAKAINVTFQQIQKYEKGTNGVSSIRLLQLSNYLKVPINYFFEDFSEYLINLEKSQEGHMNVNYNFLTKLYSELSADQKLKFNKSLQISGTIISKAVFFKFRLGKYQDEYFAQLNTPNPVFLKKIDNLVENYIWDWESVFEKNKIVY